MSVVLPGTPAARAQALDEDQSAFLERHGPLRVGVVAEGAPALFVDADGELRGYAWEIISLAAIKAGVDVEFAPPAPSIAALVEQLRTGEVDVLGTAGPRPDLLAFATPTDPVARIPITFVATDAHPEFTSASDIEGRVSAVSGSPMEALLAERFPHLEVVPTGLAGDGIRALLAGEIDAYLGPLAAIGWELKQNQPADLRTVGEPVDVVDVSYWTRTDDPMLTSIVGSMRDVVTDASIGAVTVKWTGFDLSPDDGVELPGWLLWALADVVVVAVAATVVIGWLARKVRARNTELRVLNAELEERVRLRTTELHARSEDLRVLAGAAGHELATPLATVGGMANLLRERGNDLAADDVTEILAVIERQTESMAATSRDLLELAESLEEPSRHEQADVADTVRRALGAVPDAAEAPIATDVPPGLAAAISPVRLERVVTNLVSNALKYGKGTMTIAASAADGTVELAVADQGPGLGDDPMAVFQPFRRGVDAGDKPGSGLGLAIVRTIVEAHDGTIHYEDARPGARFVIRLPAAQRS